MRQPAGRNAGRRGSQLPLSPRRPTAVSGAAAAPLLELNVVAYDLATGETRDRGVAQPSPAATETAAKLPSQQPQRSPRHAAARRQSLPLPLNQDDGNSGNAADGRRIASKSNGRNQKPCARKGRLSVLPSAQSPMHGAGNARDSTSRSPASAKAAVSKKKSDAHVESKSIPALMPHRGANDPGPSIPPSDKAHTAAASVAQERTFTDEEVMMLCGVHPGSSTADWFLELRHKVSPSFQTEQVTTSIPLLGTRGRYLSYPPPAASAGPAHVNKRRFRRQLEQAQASPATPLQVPEERIRAASADHKESPPTAVPVSPSGLTKRSLSRSSGSDVEEGSPAPSSLSSSSRDTSSAVSSTTATETTASDGNESVEDGYDVGTDEGTLRRHNLVTADRELISQFDQLREQRRLLSVKQAQRRRSGQRDSRQTTATTTAPDYMNQMGSNSAATGSFAGGTGSSSPRPIQQTVVYGSLPPLRTQSMRSDAMWEERERPALGMDEAAVCVDLGPRVVVLSLGPITPLYRSNYDYYLKSLHHQMDGTALVDDSEVEVNVTRRETLEGSDDEDDDDDVDSNAKPQVPSRQADSEMWAAKVRHHNPLAAPGAQDRLVLVPEIHEEQLALHPTVPPYHPHRRPDGNTQPVLYRRHSRTANPIGGRLGQPPASSGKCNGRVQGGVRLPPLESHH